jgi:hypothetical protein
MKEMRIKKIDRTAIRFIFPSRTLYMTIQLDLPGFSFLAPPFICGDHRERNRMVRDLIERG